MRDFPSNSLFSTTPQKGTLKKETDPDDLWACLVGAHRQLSRCQLLNRMLHAECFAGPISGDGQQAAASRSRRSVKGTAFP